MNACDSCKSLDGQPSDIPAHEDLRFMSAMGFGVPGDMTESSRTYRCERCDAWVSRHGDAGETPNKWEVRIPSGNWYENGYQVIVDVGVEDSAELFNAWYQIYAGGAGESQGKIIVPMTRAPGAYPTQYQAWSAAITLGQLAAQALPKR